jgi:hypothetical protein
LKIFDVASLKKGAFYSPLFKDILRSVDLTSGCEEDGFVILDTVVLAELQISGSLVVDPYRSWNSTRLR